MARSPRTPITLADETRNPRSRGLRRLVMLLAAAVVGFGGWYAVRAAIDAFSPTVCTVTANGQTFEWAPDQASNTAAITAIALKRGLPARAATIAIATAMQESKVRNIAYGDRDSVGLFQQRPSQGWGTAEQIMNPEYSSNAFYDALIKVPGWETADIATAAQAVQRSADGTAYAQHESKARATASVLAGHSPAAIGCRIDLPDKQATPDKVRDMVRADFEVGTRVLADKVIITANSPEQAWAIASWGVARSIDSGVVTVTLNDREWKRSHTAAALSWHDAASPTNNDTVVLSVR